MVNQTKIYSTVFHLFICDSRFRKGVLVGHHFGNSAKKLDK